MNGITIDFGDSHGLAIETMAFEWNGDLYTSRYTTGDYFFIAEWACEIWGYNPHYWLTDTRPPEHSILDAYMPARVAATRFLLSR